MHSAQGNVYSYFRLILSSANRCSSSFFLLSSSSCLSFSCSDLRLRLRPNLKNTQHCWPFTRQKMLDLPISWLTSWMTPSASFHWWWSFSPKRGTASSQNWRGTPSWWSGRVSPFFGSATLRPNRWTRTPFFYGTILFRGSRTFSLSWAASLMTRSLGGWWGVSPLSWSTALSLFSCWRAWSLSFTRWAPLTTLFSSRGLTSRAWSGHVFTVVFLIESTFFFVLGNFLSNFW